MCIRDSSSVLEPFRELERLGYRVDYVGTDEYGRVRPEEVFSKLRKDTGIVSIMHVNNESGAINDIDAIAQGVKQRVPDCIVPVSYTHLKGSGGAHRPGMRRRGTGADRDGTEYRRKDRYLKDGRIVCLDGTERIVFAGRKGDDAGIPGRLCGYWG